MDIQNTELTTPYLERQSTKDLLAKIKKHEKSAKYEVYWKQKYDYLSKKYNEDLGKFIKKNKDTLPKSDWGKFVYTHYGWSKKSKGIANRLKKVFQKEFIKSQTQ